MEHGPIDHQSTAMDGAPPSRRPWRLTRWAVPAAAVLAVGGVIAGMTTAGAQAAPVLPPRSAAQLLTDVATSAGPGPMTATISESANLGLPALPGSDSPSSAYSLLSGTHTFNIWYADPAHVRISEPVQLGESDLRVNGHQVWLWDSKTQTATHVVPSAGAIPVPGGGRSFAEPLKPGFMPHIYKMPGRVCVIRPVKGQAKPAEKCMKAPAGRALWSSHPIKVKKLPGGKVRVTLPGGKTRTFTPPAPPKVSQLKPDRPFQAPTPQQAARQILAALGPTTTVSVQNNVTVAGQAAYQISLAPKDHQSLVGRVQVAIDAAKHFPLRLQVFARGSAAPAFQIGFTSLTFGRPAASNFSFTPPAGAKVKKVAVPTGPLAGPFGPGALLGPRTGWYAYSPLSGGSFSNGGGFANAPAPRVVGQGWLSVLVVTAPSTGGTFQMVSPAGSVWSHGSWVSVSASTGKVTAASIKGSPPKVVIIHDGSTPVGRALQQDGSLESTGPGPASLGPLLKAATPVHGAWGSGRLLRTSLFDVLITSKGAVLAGAVQPSVLYADAAALK
jgi:outer membrane lipoprotein-sorting protein